MSADSYSFCPACLAKQKGVPVTSLTVQEIYNQEGNFAAYEENYIDNGILHMEYRADCRNCDYHIQVHHKEPIPGVNE